MHQLIEHVRSPQKILEKCNRWLAQEGIISIETPQYKGWDFDIFKNRYWGGYHFPRHFFIFSSHSLEKIALENNLYVVESRSIASPVFWITSIHNFLCEVKFMSYFAKFFKYNNPILLVIFTLIELVQLKIFNKSSNLRVILGKKR